VDRFVSWSPDGRTIAVFNHDDGMYDDAVYKYNVKTKVSREYAASGADCCGYVDLADLAWGPRGQFGYSAADRGDFGDARPVVQIIYPGFVSAEGDRSPAPSPSGRRLAFIHGGAGGAKIYVATAAGGHRRAVTRGHQPDWQPRP
jgi:Tol biopolymer transport system component